MKVEWVEDKGQSNVNPIGSGVMLGGWFDSGDRWKDYINSIKDEYKPYFEALRQSILGNNIKITGEQMQNNFDKIPLFEDGKTISFTWRAWGDLMAAVWSEKENKDYHYMDFYM